MRTDEEVVVPVNEVMAMTIAAMTDAPTMIISRREERAPGVFASQHFLYFRPLPQGHRSFRPGLAIGKSFRPGQSTTMKTAAAFALADFCQ
jgi:hypothetical protein